MEERQGAEGLLFSDTLVSEMGDVRNLGGEWNSTARSERAGREKDVAKGVSASQRGQLEEESEHFPNRCERLALPLFTQKQFWHRPVRLHLQHAICLISMCLTFST